MIKDQITDGMNRIIEILRQDQSPNGSWNYPFETGISTDCYMIILLRSLDIHEENLINQLTERIISRQEKNGAWKLYYDEPMGNVSATVEAYYALLYSGYYDQKDQRLLKAKQYILSNGGIENSHMFTKIMLAMTGQLKWPSFSPLPLEMILLPPSFPINFYHFSVFGRANLTPIMLLTDKKFRLTTKKSPDLSNLFLSRYNGQIDHSFSFRELKEWRSLHSIIEQGINRLIGLPSQIHQLATEHAKQYMLARIEPDGTLLSYFSSTFLMIFALLSLGYEKTSPLIVKAVSGLKSMKCEINGLPHMQYTTATVWNTSLINFVLQEAGVSSADPTVKKANDYLLGRQQYKYGDWVVHNRFGSPGGWGFSNINTIQPDVDDTTASLRSIARNVQNDPVYLQAWEKGIRWVLSMQNTDGGWPSFEKNTNNRLLQLFPIEGAEYLINDPSSADLTGRTLEFLGSYTNLTNNQTSVRSAINWLVKHQEMNGSWYGRWGICFIYGTWAAITGLRAGGVLPTNHSITKSIKWLNEIQNNDGGWGESCRSDREKKYIPLKTSTLTDTAWAVDALISSSEKPTHSIKNGVDYLLKNMDQNDWTTSYPKGQGMAGAFYIHYHSYQYIFPLLALSHFQNKYLM